MNRNENFYKILIKNKTSEFLLLFYLLFIKFKEIVIIPRVTAVNEKVNGIFFLFTAFTFTFIY